MVRSDKSLLAWYRCESVTGNSLVNELGSNNATLSGVTLVSGGCPHDGVSAIQCPGNTSSTVTAPGWFNNQGVQTVAFWFKAAKNSTLRTMFSHIETTVANRVYVNIDAGNVVEVVVGGTTVDVGVAADWTADTWQHVAVVRDATNDKTWAYLNGNLKVSNASTTIADSTSGADVKIGGLNSSQFYDGQLDDIRVYNRFLTQGEIRAIMNGFGYAK